MLQLKDGIFWKKQYALKRNSNCVFVPPKICYFVGILLFLFVVFVNEKAVCNEFREGLIEEQIGSFVRQSKNTQIQIRVVGGEYVSSTVTLPYIAAIMLKKQRYIYCTGALVSPDAIVTAAHCVDPETIDNIQVQVGSIDVSKTYSGFVRNVVAAHVHPSYLPLQSHDIAVLILDSTIDAIEPAQILSTDISDGEYLWNYGYGYTSDPTVNPNVQTSPRLKRISLAVIGKCYTDDVCMQAYQKGDTCNGDSGGPVTRNQALVALTSRGAAACGSGKNVAVATLVNPHRDWINEIVQYKTSVHAASSATYSPSQGSSPGGISNTLLIIIIGVVSLVFIMTVVFIVIYTKC